MRQAIAMQALSWRTSVSRDAASHYTDPASTMRNETGDWMWGAQFSAICAGGTVESRVKLCPQPAVPSL